MELLRILNHCHRFRGFAYRKARFRGKSIEVAEHPRKRSAASPSATLGIQLAYMGRKVPRRMAPPDHPFPHRTHEEDRRVSAPTWRTDPELFPGSEAAFQRRCRGSDNKAKVIMRKTCGVRTFRVLQLATDHSLAKLPEPDPTHDFFWTNPFL
jgi:hypothetical protein